MKKRNAENTNNNVQPGKTARFFIEIAEITRFTGRLLREMIRPPYETSELLPRSAELVIVCTGFSERRNKGRSQALGIKGFPMKPVVRLEMAKMVRKVLD